MAQTRSQKKSKIVVLRYRRSEHALPASSKAHQSTISGRITKSTTSVTVSRTKRVESASGSVVKTEHSVYTTVKRRTRSLKVRLSGIDYSKLPAAIRQLDYKIQRAIKRQNNYKGRYLPVLQTQHNNRYGFVFGHNPFAHTEFKGPTKKEQEIVYNLMSEDLKKNFNKDCFLDQPDATTNELQGGPMHMSEDLTVDNLVKVILSISTENSLAIRQHAQLCSAFTYTIDGKEVTGTVPNYHKMRVCSPDKLVKALNIAGYQNMRQKAFHAILSEIYAQNINRLRPFDVITEGNELNASNFVPGLLSMEYLKSDNLTKQEQFDLLVKFDQIAVKTGCCLLAFNLKEKVFVVDTHVHQMTRNLGWIPEDCHDADKACMFLDTNMPENLKFGLHQAFWHHRINCARCMPRANPKSKAYQERICPLEHLIRRDLPPMNRSVVQIDKGKNVTKPKRKSATPKEKRLAGSVAFLNMHHKVANEKGYVLRRVEIDDNFGEGSRQNKSAQANYYWGLKQFAHVHDIVKLDDALRSIDMSIEEYEARFTKKVRTKKPKQAPTKKGKEKAIEESDNEEDGEDVDMEESMEVDDESELSDVDEAILEEGIDIDMADAE